MPSVTTPCTICAVPMKIHPTSGGPGRMTHRACTQSLLEPIADKPARCAFCMEAFDSKRRAASRGGRWIRCCSKSCARKLEIKEGRPTGIVIAERLSDDERRRREFDKGEQSRRRRRARLAGVEREPYTTASIAARDDYRCSLCGGLVDMALKWPEAGSASVDHILPISRGGADTLANVALAHFGCNVSKGNRL